MIKTIYNNDKWGQVQQEKESGLSCVFHFSGKAAELDYFFIKRIAGVVNGYKYYDIVTPRGESGIELTSGELCEDDILGFEKCFNQYCIDNDIVAEYVRFDPWNQVADSFSEIYKISHHGFAYCVNLHDDDFFAHQCSSKRRNLIRKSLNSELTIDENVPFEMGIESLLNLYEYTDEKYNVSDYYKISKEFLCRYVEMLDDKVSFCLVKYKDEPISAGMFLNGGDVYHYHFTANNPNYSNLNASSLMLYKEMVKAQTEGCKIFDLGSATPGSGLEVFKKSWCSEENIINCFLGTKVRNQEVYMRLIEINGHAEKGVFPEYCRI